MAYLNDVIKALRNTATEIQQSVPSILLQSQVTAKSIIQDRIQETGRDHKGKQLGEYSTKKIPAFFHMGKGKKSTDVKLKKSQKEKKLVSYADFRQMDGKQIKHVDLTFTGQMFRQTGLVGGVETAGSKMTVTMGQTTERSKKVAGYNEERYGKFLSLSEEELERLGVDASEEVVAIINKNLGDL